MPIVIAWNDRVSLKDVKVLTLSKEKWTTARRGSPIKQLNCVGGSAHGYDYQPDVVQCTNVGFDGHDFQWECKADLDTDVRFGRTTVSCEGYSNSDDPDVLRDSCGLEYTLDFTNEGKSKNHNSYNSPGNYNYGQHSQSVGSGFGTLLTFIFLFVIIVGIMRQCAQNQAGTYGSAAGGGYYPGGGAPGSYPGSYPGSGPSCPPGTNYPSAGPTYQPGFWSGMGAGGLLGYMFGRRTPGYSSSYGYGAPTWGARPGFGFGGSSFCSGSRSSSTRTASAFAGTTRR